jgi:hypothetical protein
MNNNTCDIFPLSEYMLMLDTSENYTTKPNHNSFQLSKPSHKIEELAYVV